MLVTQHSFFVLCMLYSASLDSVYYLDCWCYTNIYYSKINTLWYCLDKVFVTFKRVVIVRHQRVDGATFRVPYVRLQKLTFFCFYFFCTVCDLLLNVAWWICSLKPVQIWHCISNVYLSVILFTLCSEKNIPFCFLL